LCDQLKSDETYGKCQFSIIPGEKLKIADTVIPNWNQFCVTRISEEFEKKLGVVI